MIEKCRHILPNGDTHCALCNERLFGGPDCEHRFYRLDHRTRRCPYCGFEEHLMSEVWK